MFKKYHYLLIGLQVCLPYSVQLVLTYHNQFFTIFHTLYFLHPRYLESNEITTILPEQISHLTQLTRLDLSNNRIGVLANNTFQGLDKLSTLIVSYNRLRCVQVRNGSMLLTPYAKIKV